MRKNLLLFWALLCCCCCRAQQQDAAKDVFLRDVFRRISAADGYHYQVSVRSLMSDTQKLAPVITENYQSRSRFLIWSRSDEAVFFVCEQGQFRVDHNLKTIWYKQYSGAALLAELRQAYDLQGTGLLDSLFLNGAVVRKKTSAGGKISYKLSYPGHMMLRDLDLVYVPRDSFISSLSYTMDRPMGKSPVRIRQVVTMDHYKKEIPEEVKRLLSAAADLEQWLKQSYNGYSLQKI